MLAGISYSPVPLKGPGLAVPDDDFMASNTWAFWGSAITAGLQRQVGRRDLGIMRALGANAVRLYGNDPNMDHMDFLNEAQSQELDVIAGFSDYPYIQMPGSCMETGRNCFHQIKEQYTLNLARGFLIGPGAYHL